MTTGHTFQTFPKFTKLTLKDREKYEALIKDYPPIYDISFPALMSWWNPLDNMAVSELNGNLVIPYWLPGDEENSGLSLVGTKKIDESICTIFDHLREKGDPVRLINVPEFVLSYIRYHDLYDFTEERDRNEYVLPLSHFYPLKNMAPHWQKVAARFIDKMDGKYFVVRNLDLDVKEDRDLLLSSAKEWRTKNKLNDFGQIEGDCIEVYIKNSKKMGIENLCLFVNGKLWGFALFQVPVDKRYIIMKHIKATHRLTCGFEILGYMFAKWWIEHGATTVNIGPDYNIHCLRMFMLTLGQSNFFRKYIIEPRS
jgi:hypothetical protein